MEWVLGALGAIAGAAGHYAISRRKSSGRINVTDADRLWEEAERVRQRLNEEAEAERMRQDRRIYELEIDILRLRRENHELRNELTKMQLLNAPNIPDDVRASILEQQARHVRDIEDALDKKRAQRPEVISE